jgi:selenide,water dikinase
MALCVRFTTGAAGARPHDWIADIGLDLHQSSLIVGSTPQTSDPDIFVTIAPYMIHAQRRAALLCAGPVPVRQSAFVGWEDALSSAKDYLKLISLGKSALESWVLHDARAFLKWKKPSTANSWINSTPCQ